MASEIYNAISTKLHTSQQTTAMKLNIINFVCQYYNICIDKIDYYTTNFFGMGRNFDLLQHFFILDKICAITKEKKTNIADDVDYVIFEYTLIHFLFRNNIKYINEEEITYLCTEIKEFIKNNQNFFQNEYRYSIVLCIHQTYLHYYDDFYIQCVSHDFIQSKLKFIESLLLLNVNNIEYSSYAPKIKEYQKKHFKNKKQTHLFRQIFNTIYNNQPTIGIIYIVIVLTMTCLAMFVKLFNNKNNEQK